MDAEIHELELTAKAALAAVTESDGLERWRTEYLGSNGRLKSIMGRLKEVPKDRKPEVGKTLNALKAALEGELKIIATIEAPAVMVKILTHLVLPARAPRRCSNPGAITTTRSASAST